MKDKSSKGFKDFLIKLVISIVALFLIRIFIKIFFSGSKLYKATILPENFMPYLKGNLFVAGIFVIFVFLIYNKDTILKLKKYKFGLKQTIFFLLLTLISLVSYYILRLYINLNLDVAYKYHLISVILLTVNILLFVIFLVLAIFGLDFTKNFIKQFKKSLSIFTLFGVIYYFAFLQFQNLWKFFSTIVTKILYFLFKLTHKNVLIYLKDPEGPILGVNKFIVSIGKPCSGIDSMLLFTSLYTLIFIIDRHKINKKRMLLLFIPGLIGIFFFNVIRVYLLMLVGIYYDPEFAVGLFHQNVGWILFIIYFALFYLLFKNYIYDKNTTKK